MNSEFSFSETSCLTKAKEPNCSSALHALHIYYTIIIKFIGLGDNTNLLSYQYFICYWLIGLVDRLIGLVGRMFAMVRETCVQSEVVIPKSQKMVLDTFLLNTQQYKVCIKCKVKQSREWSSALPYTSV